MKCFEYIKLDISPGLSTLCSLGSCGWHVVGVIENSHTVLLERKLSKPEDILATREFFRSKV